MIQLFENRSIISFSDFINEMAYPSEFNIDEFKSIKTYSGRIEYANRKLRGVLGSGSSRAVFKIDDNMCLKVAINPKGISQNNEEINNTNIGDSMNYPVLAKIYDYDQDGDTWLEMELAKRISSPKRFKELTHMSFDEIPDFLHMSRSENPRNGILTKEMFDVYINDENSWARTLSDFVNDFDYPIPGDFDRLSSYGEVTRDGEQVCVIIDYGASKHVISLHYNNKR